MNTIDNGEMFNLRLPPGITILSVTQDAIEEGVLKNGRQDLFLITKHWRKYHGYEPANKCLDLSLKRLQLYYIDLW